MGTKYSIYFPNMNVLVPLGESRFDVAKRVYDMFSIFYRDAGLVLNFALLSRVAQYREFGNSDSWSCSSRVCDDVVWVYA